MVVVIGIIRIIIAPPFIRNVAGPMDYIPGTMNNATKKDFSMNGDKPMGQGTRAHSIAMAVITESPMQMLSDAQPLYYNNRECAEFLLGIPVGVGRDSST